MTKRKKKKKGSTKKAVSGTDDLKVFVSFLHLLVPEDHKKV